MVGDFKGTVYQKIWMGHYNCPRKNNLQILFFCKLEKNLLSTYMENTPNGEKSVKIKHISVKNRTPWYFFWSSLPILLYIGSIKPKKVSRYCPFKGNILTETLASFAVFLFYFTQLSAYMENTPNGEKVLKLSISRLKTEHHVPASQREERLTER